MAKPTSDAELAAAAREHVPGFVRVCARDALTARDLSTPGNSAIINMDPSYTHSGTHWCAVRRLQEKEGIAYVDSFGIAPPDTLIELANSMGLPVYYSTAERQALGTQTCGQRALLALIEMAREPKKDLAALRRL